MSSSVRVEGSILAVFAGTRREQHRPRSSDAPASDRTESKDAAWRERVTKRAKTSRNLSHAFEPDLIEYPHFLASRIDYACPL